jgi:hypothetical protein
VSSLNEIGDRDGWRCWVCDSPVDGNLSVNDDLGPSLDRCELFSTGSGRKKSVGDERLAHRACNTKKGATKPTIAWPSELILFDPAPIIQSAERLAAKGGREVVARCASKADANEAATWLLGRLSRLIPRITFTSRIDEGGGQFMVSLLAPRP